MPHASNSMKMEMKSTPQDQETSQFPLQTLKTDDSVSPKSNANAFKDTFKYYRRIGVEALETLTEKQACLHTSNEINPQDPHLTNNNSHDRTTFFGLKPLSAWEIHRFKFPEGLIYIRNPFTSEGQRFWISRCVLDFPKLPHITNIENLRQQITSAPNKTKSSDLTRVLPEPENNEAFYRQLRWATFGYHHDWDTKIYSKDRKCEFPKDLALLTEYFSLALGFKDFRAEAAISNYYHLDSTLSGHQDRSELNQEAPLFSISFGQRAIFLIGGETKEIPPIPVILESGDVVVMSGKSRLSYHGVPKVTSSITNPWLSSGSDSSMSSSTDVEPSYAISSKKRKLDNATNCSCELCEMCSRFDATFEPCCEWSDFLEKYISRCRVNLNIRQVL